MKEIRELAYGILFPGNQVSLEIWKANLYVLEKLMYIRDNYDLDSCTVTILYYNRKNFRFQQCRHGC